MPLYIRCLLLIVLFQVIYSCSSTKRRDEQGPLAKAWHNTNAHYNGYFNAREIMDESMLSLSQQHADNYNQRLKMFPFLAVDNPGAVAGELDRAIEKVAVVVKKHPYSNWTDDSYLLVGQAQLIKQDYESAERTLRFAMNEFRPRPKRKKGKEGEEEGEEFESKREVEASEAQSRRDRIRARREAQRERERTIKQREKEQRAEEKRRKRERKAKIRARKRGIRTPRTTPTPAAADTAALQNEPEPTLADSIDFDEADRPFTGMITLFGNTNEATGGGEYGDKADGYLLKHRPAYQEIRLWLAWTLIKRDNFDRAQIILDDLRNNRGTFSDVREKALAVQAYLYLEQERDAEAIPFLEAAAEVAEQREERARYYFIAGQLYQELGQPGQAVAAFDKVVAQRPDYAFELAARIAVAQNEYLAGGGSPDGALRNLERMAKEEKNIPYQSQILYSMAGIALRGGDEAAGREYLRRALASPAGDVTGTRTEAYQLLADLAYGEEDYLDAKLYYDSSLQVMQQTDLRYEPTTERRDRITGVAANLLTIGVQDSLLRIGNLPEPDRRRWAQEVFELRRATNSAANFSTPVTSGSLPVANRAAIASVGSASFWGYNEQAVRRGQRDFVRRWGDRPLQDNWRRGQRTNTNLFVDEDDTATGIEEEVAPSLVTDDELDRILADIPTDEEAKESTRARLAEAYFNLGREYRDRVGNPARSIEAFETLDRRFPASDFEAEALYYQYLLYKDAGRNSDASEVARRLEEGYPGTKFAKLANDPGYGQSLIDEEGRRERTYERAYQAFTAGSYPQADGLIEQAVKELPQEHELRARYALLAAMTKGKLEGRAAYIAGLQQVIAQHEGTPEQTRAREILRLLGESGARLPGRADAGGGNFRESFDEIHYMFVAFSNPEVRLNDLKVALEDYHQEYHKQDRLRITPIFIGQNNETPVLLVRRFQDADAAMEYYAQAQRSEEDYLQDAGEDFQLFPVSQTNYREILKARSIEGYEEWFEGNY